MHTGSQVGTREGSSKASAPVNAVVDDRLYIFEAVGLLLGQVSEGVLRTPDQLCSCHQLMCCQLTHDHYNGRLLGSCTVWLQQQDCP
jgi:hypothetical protein